MASIGWIDLSWQDRNRIGSVLDMLRPEGMVDELGMGTLRDALANQLFPGISTIQTRAKYFFIIPYILRDYQLLKPAQRKNRSASKYLEQREYEVMWDLGDYYRALAADAETRESYGVIGITKARRGKDFIVRRPSAIYWNGLYTYQFIDTKGLAAESFLSQSVNPSLDSLLSSLKKGDDSDGDDADAEHENIFKIKVPLEKEWKKDIRLDLTRDEAEFFRDQIIYIAGRKLIGELMRNEKLWEVFNKSGNFSEFAKAAVQISLTPELTALLVLAHDFSELMYGAHIAYNCILHHRKFNSDYFNEEWTDWLNNIKRNMLNYAGFSPDDLLNHGASTRDGTRHFIRNWWELTRLGFPDLQKRDKLVEQQEVLVKGGKARLLYKKTENIRKDNWVGLRHFEYRFFQARTILTDIKTGLQH